MSAKRQITDLGDPRLVKALAHPLRVQILAILERRTASPRMISDELSEPLGNVSYHVRTLANMELIKLVRSTPRRGAIEHYYEAVGRIGISDRVWSDVPAIVKTAMASTALSHVGEFASAAAATGGFNEPDAHLTRTPMILDRAGWRELSKELMAFYERARKIAEASEQRVLADQSHRVNRIAAGMVLMLFEGEDVPARPAGTAPKRRRRATAAAAARTP
jgi:DNA-binding transcriptional ArsR family regulator